MSPGNWGDWEGSEEFQLTDWTVAPSGKNWTNQILRERENVSLKNIVVNLSYHISGYAERLLAKVTRGKTKSV